MTKGNDPVTPHLTYNETSGNANGFLEGMSKREYFIFGFMKEFASSSEYVDVKTVLEAIGLPPDTKYEYPKHWMQYNAVLAESAYNSLIEQLNKTNL